MGNLFRLSVFFIIVALLSILSGCSSYQDANNGTDKIEIWSDENSQAIFSDIPEGTFCSKKKEVSAELGVPGVISGFDCLSASGDVQVAYREYEDGKAGLKSLSTWVFPKSSGYKAVVGKNWYALYDRKIARAFSGIKIEGEFPFYGEHEYIVEDASVECVEISSAFIFDYAYNGTDIPDDVNEELASLIEHNYSSMRARELKKKMTEDDGELTVMMGNKAEEINLWCAKNEEVYR